jgi:aminoglycoside phosphotransferase (APT) family kinase protein
MHLCEGRSPLIHENPASREHSAHGEIPDVLSALQSALSASGELQGLVTPVAPSRTLARSTVYFAGDTAAPAKGCRWVVKQHRQNGGQIDLEEPLHAAEQFRSLATLHRHFRSVDEPLGVPRPVALFGDLDAFAMQHVAGVQVNRLLRPAAVINPAPAMEGARRSGLLLSRLHDAARSAATRIDTRAMADGILELAASASPDISLPTPVRRVLEALPSRVLDCPTVGLHGDFAPVNVIVDRSGGAYAIDVDHYRSGVPEQDIARYLTLLGTDRLFMVGCGAPGVEGLRRRLEQALLAAYDAPRSPAIVLDLEVTDQLLRRWMTRVRGRRIGLRRKAIDRRFRTLLEERGERIRRAAR